jgi:4-amino-4-deoxy-L-arabinose transferase-like glycosyltransferase
MDRSVPANQTKWLYIFIAMAVAVNFSGLFITLIGPDATLYATIAKTMVLRHDYIDLFARGDDWLDKPHFPFWVTALFFNCFGITTWAYKLPGILFLMMGAVYTYCLAKSLYNKQVALWAVLILLTAQHIVISDNDVRAEPYLTGLIIASVYHFYRAHGKKSLGHLLIGCVFAACAIMTKGMFAIIPIGGAIAGQFMITRQWKQLFSWRWLVAIIVTLLLVLPELYCLYQQFDLHPEKVIFGQKGVSGIKFFFWDSQFGRFFNTGPIKGGGDPFFFVHTTLWAFLPWSLLLFAAIFQTIKKGIKNVQGQEWYCLCAGLLTFLLFSASQFQLPYYLNIVYPFFAIITAQYLYNIQLAGSIKAVRMVQIIVITLVLLTICALQYFFLPQYFTWPVVVLLATCYIMLLVIPRRVSNGDIKRMVISTVLATFIVNLYLNLAFYPSLLKYQAGSEAAMWINQHNPHKYPVAQYGDDYPWPLQFYLNEPLTNFNLDGTATPPKNTFILYTSADVIKDLIAKGWHIQQTDSLNRYWISRLKPAFLNYKTRAKQLTPMRVVIVNQDQKDN